MYRYDDYDDDDENHFKFKWKSYDDANKEEGGDVRISNCERRVKLKSSFNLRCIYGECEKNDERFDDGNELYWEVEMNGPGIEYDDADIRFGMAGKEYICDLHGFESTMFHVEFNIVKGRAYLAKLQDVSLKKEKGNKLLLLGVYLNASEKKLLCYVNGKMIKEFNDVVSSLPYLQLVPTILISSTSYTRKLDECEIETSWMKKVCVDNDDDDKVINHVSKKRNTTLGMKNVHHHPQIKDCKSLQRIYYLANQSIDLIISTNYLDSSDDCSEDDEL